MVPLAAALPTASSSWSASPTTYSRTKALFSDYLTAFAGADEVLVTDIYAAREKDPGDIHATQLVEALQRKAFAPPTPRISTERSATSAPTGSRAT